MPDIAHRQTDEIIAALEKRIGKEYGQAVKEVEGKLDDYLRRFELKDKRWKEWVADGKRTEEEYRRWRKGQIAMGERWADLRNDLSRDLHRTNVLARDMANAEKPGVYALNHDYMTYSIEQQAHIDTSYVLYSRDTTNRIIAQQPKILPDPGRNMKARIAAGKDIAWQEGQIQSVTLQAIIQGESIPAMAQRIARTMGETNHNSTLRYCRTAITGAENAGRIHAMDRATAMGIPLKKCWMATLDSRTREAHRYLDGQTADYDKPFHSLLGNIMYPGDPNAAAANIWNCFPGDTVAAWDSDVQTSYKHEYSGELVTVKTAGGVCFTCTPNHPILTPCGWVHAKALNKGDDLCVTFRGDDLRALRVDPNVNHGLSRIDAIHKFFNVMGGKRRSSLMVDFHGDIPASDVEIVSKERLLRNNGDACEAQEHDELGFKDTGTLVFCKGHLVLGLVRIYITALRLMSGGGKALSFLRRCLRHPSVHGFGAVSDMDSVLAEYPVDNLPGETVIRRELLDGLPGKVFLDKIVSVNVCVAKTHVYNLQTKNGYYFVNSSISGNGIFAIAKNCRCTLITQVEGYETDSTAWRPDEYKDEENYAAWRKEKAVSLPITYQEDVGAAIRQQYINEYRRR